MAEPASGTPPSVGPPEDRLDSWKEIAAYLNRDVTTVQRWEKRERMPIHRHLHDRMGSVYALRSELDAWVRSRNLREKDDGLNTAFPAPAPAPAVQPTQPYSAPWLRSVSTRLVVLTLAAVTVIAIVAAVWLQRMEYFWRSPIGAARFEAITDFDGVEQAAALSHDGHFVAFLSNRDGKMDVWVTQVGSGQFHNLTSGSTGDLANQFVRTLEFSPDDTLITFWVRKQNGSKADDIGTWAVPTLGGQPRLYLEGGAEPEWSRDGARLTYHTTGTGDPLFVTEGSRKLEDRPIHKAAAGLHSHFPMWAPDGKFIYFVQGSLPDKMDIWRMSPAGAAAERITFHNAHVTHPVFLDQRTLLYLSSDSDGSGPWLYQVDVERRVPHRLSSGLDRYTSLAASADGHRLVVTRANPKRTLWTLPVADAPVSASEPVRIPLGTNAGFSPRWGPNYLLYVSATGTKESIWKMAAGAATELWSAEKARVIGGPAISSDGQSVAFSVRQHQRTSLYVMHDDGSNLRIVTDSLAFEGDPAWSPDNRSITSAVDDHGLPHLFRIPIDGRSAASFVREYSVDPAWSPDGRFIVYSGPDVGTKFSVKAVSSEASEYPMPALTLTRGARHLEFLEGKRILALLRGDIQHKNLWLVDLETGTERQLTNLPADFDIRDFDISPDGRQVVLERVQERSDIVMLDLPRP